MPSLDEELLEHINVGCPWLHFWGLRQACDTVCGIQSGPSGDHKRRQEDKRVWEDGGVCVFPRSLGLNWFKSITAPRSPDSMGGGGTALTVGTSAFCETMVA